MSAWRLPGILLFASALMAQESTVDQGPVVSRAVVPVVGSVQGGFNTVWRTEVTIENRTGQDQFVTLTLVSDPSESFFSTMMGVGESVTFGDVSQEAFGKAGLLSPLLVQTIGDRSVSVRATTHAVRESEVIASHAVPVIYGKRPRGEMVLGPVTHDKEVRTNIGLVNLNETPVNFTISIQKVPGRSLAVNTLTVPPRGMVHSLVDVLFPLLEEGRDLMIIVDPSEGNAYAYASMIRNNDGSTRFFAPR
jgi:hypothetical protein